MIHDVGFATPRSATKIIDFETRTKLFKTKTETKTTVLGLGTGRDHTMADCCRMEREDIAVALSVECSDGDDSTPTD